MKLIFLGTAGDAISIMKGRSAGGWILASDDTRIHVDPGPGAVHQSRLLGINIRETTSLIATNADLYTSHDLEPYIDAMTYSGMDNFGVVILPKPLAEGEHRMLKNRYCMMVERIIPAVPEQRIGINDVELKILPTSREDSFGIRFTLPEGSITYTGDTDYRPELLEHYQHSRILIINLPHFEETARHGLCVEDVKRILLSSKPKLAILTKLGGDILKNDPVFLSRKIQLETGVPVISAKEGMIIDPAMYSNEAGQKTLRPF